MLALPFIVMGEVRDEGELVFSLCDGELGVQESKAEYPTPILLLRSAILD